jgi:hypothetical protein
MYIYICIYNPPPFFLLCRDKMLESLYEGK